MHSEAPRAAWRIFRCAQGIASLVEMCKADVPEHQAALDGAVAMYYFSVTEPGACA